MRVRRPAARTQATRKSFNMAGGDDDYGDAFKKAKLEHDQQLEAPTEAKRLQAEADADVAVLSNVVLPQLQAAAQKLHPLGGKAVRPHRKNLTARVGCIPHNGSAGSARSARSAELWKGPSKPRLFDCSARWDGHGHLRVGAPESPAWYHNLVANPQVTVTEKGVSTELRARVLTPEAREQIWPKIVAAYKGYGGYQEKTSRTIPVVALESA